MKRFPRLLQDSENSCGAYCIKMILNYYHIDDEIRNIKKKCRMTREGITVYGLICALKQYHIEAKAYQCQFKDLDDELEVPAILHLKHNGIYHYVVVYRKHDEYFIIGDPAKGLVKMSYEALYDQFTGIIILIGHVGHPVSQIQCYSFLRFIKDHLLKYRFVILSLSIKNLIISVLTVVFSFYYRLLIDYFANSTLLRVFAVTLAFVFIYMIRALFDWFRQRQIISLRVRLSEQYITKTIQNLIYQDFSFFFQYEKGVILSRANQLLTFIDYFIELYQVLFMDVMLMIVTMIFLLMIHPVFFIVCTIMIIMIGFMCFYFNRKVHLKNKYLLEYKEGLEHGILEYQENFFHTIQFRLKRTMKNKIGYLYDNYFIQESEKEYLINQYRMIMDSLIQFFLMISVFIALYLVKEKIMSLGTVIFIYMLLSYLLEPLMRMSSLMIFTDEIRILFERYKELIPEKQRKKKKIRRIHSIEIKDVTFSYGYGRPLFEHLQFQIDHSFVLKGEVGSGKSTFLKMITGQLETVKGQILVNHIDLRQIDENSFYERIRYLDKEAVFYQESLRFNMILDDRQKENRMTDLLSYFMLEELLPCLNQKLDIKGGFLSSGQAQLVMIIRALLCDIDVLILDEAFSNVDQQRRELLLDYLANTHMLVIIVSHQIKMMNNDYDYVIIEEGKLKSEGQHGNRFSNN